MRLKIEYICQYCIPENDKRGSFMFTCTDTRESLRLSWALSVLPFHTAAAPSFCLLKAQTLTSYCRSGAEKQDDHRYFSIDIQPLI